MEQSYFFNLKGVGEIEKPPGMNEGAVRFFKQP